MDILITEALRSDIDKSIILVPMPAVRVKGFAEPVVTYAVKGPDRIEARAAESEVRVNLENP